MRASLWLLALVLVLASWAGASVPVPDDYEPPFFPEGRPLEGLVITIDAGHGGSSFSGGYHGSARGTVTRVVEGDLNMHVTALLYHHLKDAGASVHMTRRDDRKVTLGPTGRAEELGARTAVAEQTRSHLFLSLHHNSSPRATAHGVMMLIWPTDKAGEPQPLEVAFANFLREEVEKVVPHSEPFSHYVVDHPLASGTDLPSAVVEFGFLSNADFDQWVVLPTSAKHEARGAYNGVVRMWQTHREELEALRDRVLPPAEPVASAAPASDPEAARIIANFRRTNLSDATTFHLDARAVRVDGELVLTGSTNFPILRDAIAAELGRALSLPVRNELRVLPDEVLGPDPFGVCTIPMAMTWGEPVEGRNVQTQLLLGEPLFLLDRNAEETHYLVHGIDGYLGWVRADAVRRVSREEFAAMMTGPAVRLRHDIMRDDFRMPPGSFVRTDEAGTLVPPDGKPAAAPPEAVRLLNGAPGRQALETAMGLLYVPYVFGGRSSQGLDCSGLVGVAWAAAGVQLPRDARQQAIVGRLVATAWFPEGMLPGDALFFIDQTGRVIHTGISLGGMRFVHASPPEVQINSLDPADPLYSAGWTKAFCFARRPAE
ncbi:MAG: N-acetylmuramoyl-L-alanine amidase [Candidatus Sumerlaeia bacterium]|nr:N-acetylmuramoyl-L-alanine amidase [Candidatus Sumerlaeia bacterium]